MAQPALAEERKENETSMEEKVSLAPTVIQALTYQRNHSRTAAKASIALK
ncbi:hypothetical protein GCM10027514_32980 [Azotobacter armeniacus]